METITKRITVDQETLSEMNTILQRNEFVEDAGRDEILWIATAKFEDGYEIDIKVCNGHGPFVDPVLFRHGSELIVGEVGGQLNGEYIFACDDKEFIVIVDV